MNDERYKVKYFPIRDGYSIDGQIEIEINRAAGEDYKLVNTSTIRNEDQYYMVCIFEKISDWEREGTVPTIKIDAPEPLKVSLKENNKRAGNVLKNLLYDVGKIQWK